MAADTEIRAVFEVKRNHPDWGVRKVAKALKNAGWKISKSSVDRILNPETQSQRLRTRRALGQGSAPGAPASKPRQLAPASEPQDYIDADWEDVPSDDSDDDDSFSQPTAMVRYKPQHSIIPYGQADPYHSTRGVTGLIRQFVYAWHRRKELRNGYHLPTRAPKLLNSANGHQSNLSSRTPQSTPGKIEDRGSRIEPSGIERRRVNIFNRGAACPNCGNPNIQLGRCHDCGGLA